MFQLRIGIVKEIVSRSPHKYILLVEINNKEELAINYNYLTGLVNVNDSVLLNTTAVKLKLGSGGYHFVVCNLNNKELDSNEYGHIMKLRYTPYQIKVMAAEEQESPYHNAFNNFVSLAKMPVIVGTLHSMLIPIAATLKYLTPNIKIAYIMTDGAALPIYFSDTIYLLKKLGLIYKTITIGHAFGGDIETVNIYNGLIAVKEILECDIAIVSMGPGIVGTGTKYGFSGIEQGYILDAANQLGGLSIAVPRVSFKDKRDRHRGISHHSLTVFSEIVYTKTNIPLYKLEDNKQAIIDKQIKDFDLFEKHNIIFEKDNILEESIKYYNLPLESMGRKYEDDMDYFKTCSASGIFASKLLSR